MEIMIMALETIVTSVLLIIAIVLTADVIKKNENTSRYRQVIRFSNRYT